MYHCIHACACLLTSPVMQHVTAIFVLSYIIIVILIHVVCTYNYRTGLATSGVVARKDSFQTVKERRISNPHERIQSLMLTTSSLVNIINQRVCLCTSVYLLHCIVDNKYSLMATPDEHPSHLWQPLTFVIITGKPLR